MQPLIIGIGQRKNPLNPKIVYEIWAVECHYCGMVHWYPRSAARLKYYCNHECSGKAREAAHPKAIIPCYICGKPCVAPRKTCSDACMRLQRSQQASIPVRSRGKEFGKVLTMKPENDFFWGRRTKDGHKKSLKEKYICPECGRMWTSSTKYPDDFSKWGQGYHASPARLCTSCR